MGKRLSRGNIRKPYAGPQAIIAATVAAAEVKVLRVAAKTPPESPRPPRSHLQQNAAISDERLDEITAAGERRYAQIMRTAASQARRAALLEKWSHKNEGTPETHERIDMVPSHRRQRPLARMAARGVITADELLASEEIELVAESLTRSLGVGAVSLEARVDCHGSGRDSLIESLGRIRLEVAYRGWREAIPEPKAMILSMLLGNVPYVQLAAIHGMHWRTARKKLITALRLWPTFKILARTEIGPDDVNAIYSRLGEGTLLAPKPKNEPFEGGGTPT